MSSPIHQRYWWGGVLLESGGTLLSVLGKQLWRQAGARGTSWLSWQYPAGLGCLIVYIVFDVFAYRLAAQSVIAACAGMAVVWNLLIAPAFLGEILTVSRLTACVIIPIGTLCASLSGTHQEVQRDAHDYLLLFSRPVAIAYYALYAVWTVLCAIAMCQAPPRLQGFALGALAGSIAGNSFVTKAAVALAHCIFAFHCEPGQGWQNPWFYLFAAFTFAIHALALLILAKGLRTHEALFLITVYEAFTILFGAVSGNFVLDEKSGRSPASLVLYALSIGIILVGLVLLQAWPAKLFGPGDLPARRLRVLSACPCVRPSEAGEGLATAADALLTVDGRPNRAPPVGPVNSAVPGGS